MPRAARNVGVGRRAKERLHCSHVISWIRGKECNVGAAMPRAASSVGGIGVLRIQTVFTVRHVFSFYLPC